MVQIFPEACYELYPIQTSVALVLAQVCAPWRSLALSMPVLWASFSLKIAQLSLAGFGDQNLRCRKFISSLLQLHLDRSNGHPLTFDIDFNKAEISPAALALVDTLIDHSERWMRVKIPFSAVFLPLYARLKRRLPRLESLDLRLEGMIGYNRDAMYLEDAPRLRRLALGSSKVYNLPFPKNQLTELHLGAAATLDMFQFMTRCPCPYLTTLILNPYYPLKLSTSQSLPPLIHLCTLVLAIRDGYSRNPIIDVLDLLTTPSLQDLQIVGRHGFLLPRHTFASFVTRSACRLVSLTITFKNNLPVPSLLDNLRTLSSLTHFAVFALGEEAMHSVRTILESLTITSDQFVLPNLVSFELQTVRFHPALLDMVESRFGSDPSCAKLHSLGYHNAPTTDVAVRRLRRFKAKGLTVTWLPSHKPSKSHLFI
ncbi:hypothetical protein GGX14DRAFT_592255 [Mycena pura]|uniref:F-box domain-containing protein n=1 Tax=Mycena pura TaxID=153505 RepID=A0AAD6VQ03_9AGAR|nr:hypothetical protein GGX14DRAFT_592255 [Mycena pura]